MGKNNNLYLRDKSVTRKTEAILRNMLKAIVDKSFRGTHLKYNLCEVWDSYISDRKIVYKGLSIQKYLSELTVELSDWMDGLVFLGSENTAREIMHLATVCKVSVEKRIVEFERICKDESLEFDIRIDAVKLKKAVQDYIKKISDGTSEIEEIICSSQKNVTLSLRFSQHFSVSFGFSMPETEMFLCQLKRFVEASQPFSLNSDSELYALVENSCLREYWLATKKVVRILEKEVKDENELFSRLPKNLKPNLFEMDMKIEHATLPEGIKVLPDSLFKNCVNLKSVMLPESVEIIEDKAFFGCEKLEKISVPKNLKRIGHEAFAFCTRLRLPVEINKLCVVEYNAFDMVGGENDTEAEYFDDYGDYDDYADTEYINDYNFADMDNDSDSVFDDEF